MTMPTLAVSGATGTIGGRVSRLLAAAGIPIRLVVRDLARAPRLPGCDPVRASYAEPDAMRVALAGVETFFMVSATESVDRLDQHLATVDAAVTAGVSRVVYLSFFGAAPDATFTLARDHWATEQHIRGSGMRFTFLRDNIYLDFLAGLAVEDGVIRGPAGEGRVAAVAQRDVGDVVAAVLSRPDDHDGRSYDITGGQALTLSEIAAALTKATGRTITYRPETLGEAYASRVRYGAPAWQVDAWVSTYTAIAAGELAGVSDAVQALAGHPPITLNELLVNG